MSTSTPSTTATGGSTAASAHGVGPHRRHGQPGHAGQTSDPFASLLALLSATGDAAPLVTDPAAAGDDTGSKAARKDLSADETDASAQNPLAALLAWSGVSTPSVAVDASGSGEATPGTAAPLASGRYPQAGQDTATVGNSGTESLVAQAPPNGKPRHDAQMTEPTTHASAPEDIRALASTASTTPPAGTPTVAVATGTDLPAVERPVAANALPATRITAWRSTTTLAHAGGPTPAASARTHESLPGAAGRAAEQAAAAQATANSAASAIATDDAAAPRGDTGIGPVADRPLPGALPAAGASDGAGQMAGGQTGDGSAPQPHDTPHHAHDAGQAPGSADRDDAGAADWTSPHVRHANVRVGEAGDNPIDIQLSVDGQAVQVSFQTDDAQARDSLARDASTALGELLQRSGMELGSVSVGGQSLTSQQRPGEQATPQQTPKAPAMARAPADAGPAPAAARPARRSDGERPLDLFV